jgi:hypothetical protein
MAFQPDGKLLVARFFNEINGVKRRSMALLNVHLSFKFSPLMEPDKGVLRLGLTVEPGQGYVLQTSTDLTDWVSIRTNPASSPTIVFEHTRLFAALRG